MKICIWELKKENKHLHDVLINEWKSMILLREQEGTTCMLIGINYLEDRKHNYTPERAKKWERERLSPAHARSRSLDLVALCIQSV